MATTRVNLDTTQYVRVTSDPLTPSALILQSHRDTVRIAFSTVKPAKSNVVFHELGGEHLPLNVPMTEIAVWALGMTERSALTVTEQRLPIEVSDRGNMGNAVFVQDQTTQSLDLPLTQDIAATTLDGDTVRDVNFFDVAVGDGALITPGNLIEIGSASTFIQARVKAVVVDQVELFSPMNAVYAGGSSVFIKTDDLIVDGSVTRQVFSVSPESDQIGDITRIILRMEASSTMDSGTFGPLAALLNGCVIRIKQQDGNFRNLLNFKTNGDFIAHCFDNSFLPNNGNNVRLFVARLTWAGQSKHGVTQRLDGGLGVGEELQIIIQDALNLVGFLSFTIANQGHEVQ